MSNENTQLPHVLDTWRFGNDMEHISRKLLEEIGETVKVLNRNDLKQKPQSLLALIEEVGDVGYYSFLLQHYQGMDYPFPPMSTSATEDPIDALFNLAIFAAVVYAGDAIQLIGNEFVRLCELLELDAGFVMDVNKAKLSGNINGWEDVVLNKQ